MKTIVAVFHITLAIFCLGFLQEAQAVVPPPDGGYPGGNTAEGQNALHDLTIGTFNTAAGWFSLASNTDGNRNTAVGAGTLFLNNEKGGLGFATDNTAIGAAALLLNTIGYSNTAIGALALKDNDNGGGNTATGVLALGENTTGVGNTASGIRALGGNTTGDFNTAIGTDALAENRTGSDNVAVGVRALGYNVSGDGNGNIGIGTEAGRNNGGGNRNIYIGHLEWGFAGEDNSIHIGTFLPPGACYIGGIFGQLAANGTPVMINSNDKLGTTTSSRRFKQDIKPMDSMSELLLALKPVTFRYTKEIDPSGTSQFGLVAEEVEKVNPDLVVRDKEGKPYSVRYDQVNAMLLNEFLKAHRQLQTQQKQIDTLAAQLKEQAAAIQKVTAQTEITRPTAQVTANAL